MSLKMIQFAKVQISERKTKEKQLFLLFFRAKVLSTKSKVQISERNTKGKLVFLCFSE